MTLIESIIQPPAPTGNGWRCFGPSPHLVRMGYESMVWLHVPTMLSVIAAVEVVIDAHGIAPIGPEYHLSIARQDESIGGPVRASSAECSWAMNAFGIDGATEDNHVEGGKVRNFWRPVADPTVGRKCACVATEPKIVEDGGEFVWRAAP